MRNLAFGKKVLQGFVGWLWNVLIWIDQGINTILGPLLNIIFKPAKFGNPDETLSSVFGKYSDQCIWCMRICKVLHFIDKDHCKNSIEADENVGVGSYKERRE